MRQYTRIYIGAGDAILTAETQTTPDFPDPVSIIDKATGKDLVVQIWEMQLDGHVDGRFTRARELLDDIEKPAGADTPPKFKVGAKRSLQELSPATKWAPK